MKTLTKCLAVILCFMVYSTNAYSERNSHHTSLPVTGDFFDDDNWIEASSNPFFPSSWSNIERTITISEGAVISAEGNLNPAKVHVYGTLTVGGNYEKTRSGGLEIHDGGLVIVEGNFESQDALKIHPGGSLVVKGKVITTGGHMTVGGNFIVNDDFATKGMDVSSSGVLVVGGQVFDRSVGGISASGDIYITHPDPIIELPAGQEAPNFSFGGIDELIEDSSENTVLKDLIITGGIVEEDDDDDNNGDDDGDVSVGIISSKDTFLVDIKSNYISVNSDKEVIVEVYNFAGERVLFQKFHAGLNELLLPSQSGLYIAVVKSQNKIYTKKIVK